MELSEEEKQQLINVVNNSDQLSDELKAKFIRQISQSKSNGDVLKIVVDFLKIAGGISNLMDLFL